MNLVEHLKRQIAFSRGAFGPGARTEGNVDHIRKELDEIMGASVGYGKALEWVDVVILALDGLTRQLVADGRDTDAAASHAAAMIQRKQTTNEARDWPDWRTSDPNKAIEHAKGGEA